MSEPSPSICPPLVLASASPRRAALLREMGLDFSVEISAAPEETPEFLSPAESALLNAWRKAVRVAEKRPEALVLGADTVVSLGAEHFGKPGSMAEAESMLSRLQGRTHQVVTGICLVQRGRGRLRLSSATTRVLFRSLGRDEIRRYLAGMNPLDKAGGYAIQDGGGAIVESIDGSFSNVVGLPVELLREELAAWPSRWR